MDLQTKLNEIKYKYFLKFIPKNAKILDVGCGKGKLTSLFKNFEIIGIDKHFENLDFEFFCMDAHHLAFKKELFDIVILSDVLEHVENPLQVIRESARVLKKNGKLLFSTVNKKPLQYPILKILDLLHKENWEKHYYRKLISPKKLNEMMEISNLRKEDIKGISFRRRLFLTNKIGLYYMGCYKKEPREVFYNNIFKRKS